MAHDADPKVIAELVPQVPTIGCSGTFLCTMSDDSDNDDRLKPRTAQEAAQRVVAILALIGKAHDPERSAAWRQKHGVDQLLSRAEEAFIKDPAPAEMARIAFSWRAEAMVSLIWALGGIAEMPSFDRQFNLFDVEMVRAALKDPHQFIADAQLRSDDEISTMEHFLYHQHWRVRDAQLGGHGQYEPNPGDPPIEELHPGIVQERRYGMSWLVGWGRDWDSVPLDT